MADIKIGLDVSELKSKAQEFQAALAANSGAIEDFLVKGAKFNEAGKLVEATIQKYTTSGQLIEQTIKAPTSASKQWKVVATSVKAASDAVDEFKQKQEKAVESSRLVAAQTTAKTTLGDAFDVSKFGAVDTAKRTALISAQNRLVSTLASSGLDPAQVQQIFARIQQGQNDIETGARAKVQKALLDVVKAYQSIERAADLAAKRQQSAADKASKELEKTATVATRAARQIYVSWEGVIRLFQVQILRRAFFNVISEITSSVQSFSELSIKIARIQATTGQGAAELSRKLIDLSAEFNLPVVEVAQAQYQLLKTRFFEAGEASDAFEQALKLSKATGLDVTRTVQLLTDAMSAFGLSSTESERAASVLFTATDKGRVNIDQLAGGIGHLGTSARTIGVNFEEALAAVSAFTSKGIKATEAISLIQSVTNKLINPTEEMNRLFRELGVATGKDAVELLGFGGILQRINAEVAKGGGGKFSELIKDFRALRGAAGFDISEFDKFLKLYRETQSGRASLDRVNTNIAESPGEKYQTTLKKLSNTITTEFGERFVRAFNKIAEVGSSAFESVGKSLAVLIRWMGAAITTAVQLGAVWLAFKTVATIPGVLVAGLISLSSNWNTLTFRIGAATASLRAFALAHPLAVAAAVASIGLLVYNYYEAERAAIAATIGMSQVPESVKKANEAQIKEFQRTHDEDIKATRRASDEKFQIVLQYFAGVRAEINKQQDELLKKNDAITKSLRLGFEDVFLRIKQNLHNFNEKVEEAKNAIRSSQKLELGIKEHGESSNFERSLIGKSDLEKYGLTLEEALKLQREAVKLFNKGIKTFDVDNIEDARKKLDAVDKLLRSNDKISELTQNVKQSKTIVRNLQDKAELTNFERGLRAQGITDTLTNPASVQVREGLATLDFAKKLQRDASKLFEQGIKAFSVENIEEARKKFEEVDNLLNKLLDKQISFREKAAKLGVVFSTPLLGRGSEIDSRIEQNRRVRIGFEEKFQKSQKDRVDAAQPEILKNQQLRIDLEKTFQQAQEQKARSILQSEQLLLKVQKELLAIEKARTESREKIEGAKKAELEAKTGIITGGEKLDATLRDLDKFKQLLDPGKLQLTIPFPSYRKHIDELREAFNKLNELRDEFAKNPNKTREEFEALIEQADIARQKLQEVEKDLRRPDFPGVGKLGPPQKFNDLTIDDLRHRLEDQSNELRQSFKDRDAAGKEVEKGTKSEAKLNEQLLSQIPDKYKQIADSVKAAGDEHTKAAKSLNDVILQSLENVKELRRQLDEMKTQKAPQLELGPQPLRPLGVEPGAPNFGPRTRKLDEFGIEERRPSGVEPNKPVAPNFVPKTRSLDQFGIEELRPLGRAGFEPNFEPLVRSQFSAPGLTERAAPSVNFGDINVTVQGGGSTEKQAREIAQMIRREVQRGNSLLS